MAKWLECQDESQDSKGFFPALPETPHDTVLPPSASVSLLSVSRAGAASHGVCTVPGTGV